LALSYQDTVLQDGPLLYVRFEETSGAACADSSGFGHNGTAAGTFTRNVATGVAGFDIGITLGGTVADFVSVPSSAALNITGDVTFEAVIKPASLPGGGTIIDRGSNSPALFGYELLLVGSTVRITDVEVGTNYAVTTNGSISAGTLYHVVLTCSPHAGPFTAYVNGALNNSGATPNTAPTGGVTEPLHIGVGDARGSLIQPFPGLLDEVAMYDKILSPARIAAHWAARNTAASSGGSTILKPPPPGLTGLLPGGPKRNPKPHPKPHPKPGPQPPPTPPPVVPPPVVDPAERVDGELKRRDDE
jgi:hypothetical protein